MNPQKVQRKKHKEQRSVKLKKYNNRENQKLDIQKILIKLTISLARLTIIKQRDTNHNIRNKIGYIAHISRSR